MKKVLLVGVAALLIGIGIGMYIGRGIQFVQKEPEQPDPKRTYGLFSWDEWIMEQAEAETLSLCIQKTDVGEIYQEFSQDALEAGSITQFVARMNNANLDVYSLIGAAEWALEGNNGLLEAIESVVKYNQMSHSDEQIAGVMVDVEPYVLSEWSWEQEDLVENYVGNLRDAYTYANTHRLKFLVCITNEYDEYCPKALEGILSQACDGIAIMNYDRTDEYGQIKDEVSLAQEYDKRVICIYELQKPGYHNLEDINTYAEVGLEALWESADILEEKCAPFHLEFAYHYYVPLKEMLDLE